MARKESQVASTQRILERLAYSVHLFASGMASREKALQYILEASVDLTSADSGSIYLYDKEAQTLRAAALMGHFRDPSKISTHDVSTGIVGRVFQTAIPYLVSDVRSAADYMESSPETRSLLAVPIRYDDELVGVLSLESAELSHFTEEQLRIVELLTSILASTFQREEIERLRTEVKLSKQDPNAETAFVLTPFNEPFNKYYSAIIRPAVQTAGLVCLRADEIFAPTEIIQDIWAAINKAKVIIAELTTRNPNVMYELGLSHAVNKPVIMITQSTSDIPFDLRSLRCILYDTTEPDWAEKLRSNLSEFIRSVITSPSRKPLFHESPRKG